MRTLFFTFIFAAITLAGASSGHAAEPEPRHTEHPGIVALSHEDGQWLYRKFPSSVRLYVYEADQPGKSMCNDSCSLAWPPLFVEDDDASPIGDWTVIARDSGRHQWAYKGRPVYMRFHDSVEEPLGDKIKGWSFLRP
tara:strand:- start:4145 stop:4558 length:414 start_codon:yes stop_codon:yes gene_type:complete